MSTASRGFNQKLRHYISFAERKGVKRTELFKLKFTN
jgi:hypothetical protein